MHIKTYPHGIDLQRNSILDVKIHPLSTADRVAFGYQLTPDDEGIGVFDINQDVLYFWDGIAWITTTVISTDNRTEDYDNNITGLRNSSNRVFTLRNNFMTGTTHVYKNGLRQSPGLSNDYVETLPNQITYNDAPDSGDILTVDYKILI